MGRCSSGLDDHNLYAFDAAGNTNCSGTPKICAPLWTAKTGDVVRSSPGVANGVVFVGSYDHNLYAFDATGNANCSGTPKTCAPLWTASTGAPLFSSIAETNGIVYIGAGDHNLYAYGLPSTGSTVGAAPTSGTVTSYSGTGINVPQGITTGPDGNLWFTNFFGNSIGRITTSGTVTTFTGTGISYPVSITTGPDGNLWFTNEGSQHDRPHHHLRHGHDLPRERRRAQQPPRDHGRPGRQPLVHRRTEQHDRTDDDLGSQ